VKSAVRAAALIAVNTGALFVACDLVAGTLVNQDEIREANPHFHHGFKPNASEIFVWGDERFLVNTDSLGLRDVSRRAVVPKTSKYRMVFIGDSFTEGVGVSYQKSFVGLTAAALDPDRYEVLNAGVSSYSPKLYYLKIKYLLEEQHLEFDELSVYVDISDPEDEVVYQSFTPAERSSLAFDVHSFGKSYSFVYRHYYPQIDRTLLALSARLHRSPPTVSSAGVLGATTPVDSRTYNDHRASWTYDPDSFRAWGSEGLQLGADNMDRLYALCRAHGIRLNIAVYPWPQQVLRRELDSRQVTFWRDFSRQRNIPFLDNFPTFIDRRTPDEVVKAYFVDGDVHWNARGHQAIADAFLAWRNLTK
jgi:hypothetical protein